MTKEELWEKLNIYEFPGIRPDDVREWFQDNPDDASLAEALAQICNRVGMMHHAINEYDDFWLDAAFCDWAELEEELVQECQNRLKKRGLLPAVDGWHYRIRPFMEEHGYRDRSGWWKKDT